MATMRRITVLAGTGFACNGAPISDTERTRALSKIRRKACDSFGGVTIRNHEGAWENPSGSIVTEEGWTIEVLDREPLGVLPRAREFAQFIRSVLMQQSVVLSVDATNTDFVSEEAGVAEVASI